MEHCSEDEARRRADLIMQLQAPIMDDFCNSFIGKTIDVLTEFYDEESGYMVGRSYADSPDIDGEVCFTGSTSEGTFAKVYITEAVDGILYGEEADT